METTFIIYGLSGLALLIVSYILLRYLRRLIDLLFDKVPGFNQIDKTLSYFISDSFGTALVGAP